MNGSIDDATLVPLHEMQGDCDADTSLLRQMADDAKQFLLGFNWCLGVEEQYFGFGIGGIVAVFFFRIIPADPDVDASLWVIVGDLPPAYLVTDESRTAGQALRTYIAAMREWVAAVQLGLPVDDLIPVNVSPTPEWAAKLANRLDMLEDRFRPAGQ